MNQPLISIILPTYNGNKFWIAQAIDSVLQQTYSNRELIIVDDGSTNNIQKDLLRYSNENPKIQYIYNEKNLGLTKTLNKAIAIAQWKYIAKIDDDDYRISKDKLEKQMNAFNCNSKLWVCWTRSIHIYEDDQKQEFWDMPLDDRAIREIMLYNCPFNHSSVLIKKEALESVGWYDPQYEGIEDRELRMRIWIKYQLMNLEEYACTYRHRKNSITEKQKSVLKRRYTNYRIFCLSMQYQSNYPNFFKSILYRIFCCLPLLVQTYLVRYIKSNKILKKII